MQRRALLASAVAGVAALAGCASPFGDRVTKATEHSFAVPEDASLRVADLNGDVTLDAHGGDAVEVDASLRGPTEASLDDASVAGGREGDQLVVAVEYAEGSELRASVDLDVRVPESVPVVGAETRNGDVTARDVAGAGEFESENGDVAVRGVAGLAVARTRNGDVEADVPAPLAGDALVRSQNGDVAAALSPDLDATVDAHTTNGEVELSGLDLEDADASERRVTGRLGDGTHEVSVATTNGDVRLESM